MWRHVVPGFFALAFISCIGCHPVDYECVVRYDPWYGYYYQYCYAVPEQDWEHRKCEGEQGAKAENASTSSVHRASGL